MLFNRVFIIWAGGNHTVTQTVTRVHSSALQTDTGIKTARVLKSCVLVQSEGFLPCVGLGYAAGLLLRKHDLEIRPFLSWDWEEEGRGGNTSREGVK